MMPAATAPAQTLIQADDLAARLGEPELVIVDCRFDLMNPAAGREAWAGGHIPGAHYADLDRDLASARTALSGRHPLPDPESFAATLGSWGINPATQVVVYDSSGGAVAARLWWLLRWAGHQRVALLDGGFPAWERLRLPVNNDTPELTDGRYPVVPGAMPVLSAAAVSQGLAAGTLLLIDARDARRYAGEIEPIDTQAGHIPGTFNRPFQTNLDALGQFRSAADLHDSFGTMPLATGQQLGCMCGSGVTACHNLLAMELAGMTQPDGSPPALYVGSWSEWIQSGERPVVSAGTKHSNTGPG